MRVFFRLGRKMLIKALERLKKKISIPIPVYHSNLLQGRVAVVTGGTSGIGLEIAKAFIRSGATVVITGRDKARIDAAIDRVKIAVPEGEKNIHGVVLDNTDVASFYERFESIKMALESKQVDILVNNAGILKGGKFSEVSEKDYDDVVGANLKGAYFMSQMIAQHMIKNQVKGNILNIASSSSLRPASSPYALSKWGLRGFTLGLAKTLAPHGIVVNGIAPGPTATPMLITDRDDIAHHRIPAKRYVMPEEIANFAVVMVSGMGRSIMGDVVYMTGGAGNLTLDDIDYSF